MAGLHARIAPPPIKNKKQVQYTTTTVRPSFLHGLLNTATHCNTLQRTATHCNVLQHTVYCKVEVDDANVCSPTAFLD